MSKEPTVKRRDNKMVISIEGDEVILKIEETTMRFTPYMAKEVGEKLFKAGCVVKDKMERR